MTESSDYAEVDCPFCGTLMEPYGGEPDLVCTYCGFQGPDHDKRMESVRAALGLQEIGCKFCGSLEKDGRCTDGEKHYHPFPHFPVYRLSLSGASARSTLTHEPCDEPTKRWIETGEATDGR